MSSPMSPQPGPHELIRLWLAAHRTADQSGEAIQTAVFYEHFWSTWLRYLSTGRNAALPQPIPWYEATAQDMVGFLATGPSDRKRDDQASSSDITRRRYWRLLERVYDFAVARGWLEINPVKEIATRDTPPPENPLGAVLDTEVWLRAKHFLSASGSKDEVSLRNRALLQLLFDIGLTSQELRNLRLSSLLYDERNSEPIGVQIEGRGALSPRTLTLSKSTTDSLKMWLLAREKTATQLSKDYLFCTGKGPLSNVLLFLIVKDLLTRASEACGKPPPVRTGPMIIRNTLLVALLNSSAHPATWVATFAGLKNVKGLNHLRPHLNEDVRITVRDFSR
ncbi:MAG: hypothetical protein EON54_00790 [Alcaligenaceae bacterium]|nr:MAG: hypothetical protein EON54_00790 [Alcaligenaceae bacterium]